jgi:single-stranded-DNA-specific exonuclease
MTPEFREFLSARLAAEMGRAAEEDALDIDVLVSPGAAARDMLDLFRALEPFGPGAPEPVYAMADVRAERAEPVRGGHIRCILADGAGHRLKAISWRSGDSAMGQRLLAAR